MLFTQAEFLVFFAAVLAGLLLIPGNRPKKALLLLASYYFYAYWDWRFLSLIWISTAVDYGVGLALEREEHPRRRKALLALSLGVNLGILATFKYAGFFVDSLEALVEPLGWELGTVRLILPIGISFYTFQTLSYSIDVYRGKLAATRSLLDFALFVAFFPQLVAGPIVRAATLLPQLAAPARRSWRRTLEGTTQFAVGLFKKVVLADNVAVVVDHVFANPGAFDAPTTWLGVAAYAIQIYCDFSGYSDMAIGLARILGYDFLENFNFPYLARGLRDFWRRWHISLSTWLRDYLYIPLGGSKAGPWRTAGALTATMLLGGLWHGAAWTFVAWGAFHGLALVVEHALTPAWRRLTARVPLGVAWKGAEWALTFAAVLVGWVLFRAQGFEAALLILRQMFWPQEGLSWISPGALVALALVAAAHLARVAGGRHRLVLPVEAWYTPAAVATMLWLSVLLRPDNLNPFIYFQF